MYGCVLVSVSGFENTRDKFDKISCRSGKGRGGICDRRGKGMKGSLWGKYGCSKLDYDIIMTFVLFD